MRRNTSHGTEGVFPPCTVNILGSAIYLFALARSEQGTSAYTTKAATVRNYLRIAQHAVALGGCFRENPVPPSKPIRRRIDSIPYFARCALNGATRSRHTAFTRNAPRQVITTELRMHFTGTGLCGAPWWESLFPTTIKTFVEGHPSLAGMWPVRVLSPAPSFSSPEAFPSVLVLHSVENEFDAWVRK